MITAETMRKTAQNQDCECARFVLEYTAGVLEKKGLEHTLLFLEVGEYRGKDMLERQTFSQLLKLMRSPDIITEWIPIGEDA